MNYRPEIDGLRAFAVLAVMFFHAGFTFFSGGYVGVDIFFVISGYLITLIIQKQLSLKQFSLMEFYERRARRILPALFFVCAVSSIYAWFWLLPQDFKSFYNSLSYLSFFAANIYFLGKSGYFATASELKPLLHTWSLSVEEQFYVVYPLLLMLIWRLGQFKRHIIIVGVFFVSFFYAESISIDYPARNFFSVFSRFWELSLGALLALANNNKVDSNSTINMQSNVLSIVGLIGILISIVFFDKSTPFPSRYALLPTIGAALVILYANPSTLVGRLLQLKPLVGMGLISYSAYLWHQPVLAFARHRAIDNINLLDKFLLLSISVGLGFFSWRYVEQPFRDRNILSRKTIVIVSVAGLLLMSFFGNNLQKYASSTIRVPEKMLRFSIAQQDRAATPDDCFFQTLYDAKTCILGNKEKVVGALIGDSHALSLSKDLGQRLSTLDIGLKFLSLTACPPVLGIYRVDKPGSCNSFNHNTFKYLLNSDQISTIVVSARWALNLSSNRFDNLEGGKEYKSSKVMDVTSHKIKPTFYHSKTRVQRVALAYQESINQLLQAGKRVILIYPIPEVGWNVPKRASLLTMHHTEPDALLNSMLIDRTSTSHELFIKRNSAVYTAFNQLNHKNLSKIFPEYSFCNTVIKGRCLGLSEEEVFYFDDNHLTNVGAKYINKQIVDLMIKDGVK